MWGGLFLVCTGDGLWRKRKNGISLREKAGINCSEMREGFSITRIVDFCIGLFSILPPHS